MSARDEILERVTGLLGDRPVRWAEPGQFIGDFDGRERTLEVFNADASEQRELLRSMRPIRDELETVAGGPVVVIFHTRAESARLHASFVATHEQAVARRLSALASATRVRTGR
jgi:plasmid stabilization system protein ParE